MANNRVDFANANNIFRLQKMGANFTPQTMAAARRIVQGAGSTNDAALVRQQLGIFKTGAGKAKQQLRAAQQTVGTFIQAGTSIEQISRGGGAAMVGVLNLVKLGAGEMDKIIRSKVVRSVFENVAKTVYGNAAVGTRAYQAARGAFRQAVPVVEAAMMGWDIGKAIQQSRDNATDKKNARAGLVFDMARGNNIDFARAQREALETRVNVRQGEGWIAKTLRAAGFDTGYDDELKQRLERRAETITAARSEAQALGIDVQDVYARAAAAKGKDASELTEIERDQALDAALKDTVDPNKLMNDSMVDTALALETPWEKIGDWFSTDDQMEAKRRKIVEEKVLPARIKTKVQRQKDAEYASQLVQMAMTDTQRLVNRDAAERTQAEFYSQRSRHKAWAND